MRAAAAVLLAVALAAAVTSLWHDALTEDEVAHIAAGYSSLRTGSLRLNPEHPPLVKDVAALPLLALSLDDTAFLPRFRGLAVDDQWDLGRRFLYRSGNDPHRIARAARLAVLVFYAAACTALFAWTEARQGGRVALLALVLFAFSPTVLAHARFVTTDVPAAAATLGAAWSFLAYVRAPTRGRFALAVLLLGLALLVKFSAVLLIVWMMLVAVVLPAPEHAGGRGRRLAMTAALAACAFVLVVWPFYAVHLAGEAPRQQRHETQEMLEQTLGEDVAARAVLWASDKPILRAAGQYAAGLLHVVERSGDRHPVFFLGSVRPSGFAAYFPTVYALKETLAWWLLVALVFGGVALSFARRGRAARDPTWARQHFEELALLLWIALYWASCLCATLQLGVRHLLPTFPFAAILVAAGAGAIVRRLDSTRRRAAMATVAVLAFAHVVSTLSVHPSYLAYFNSFAGGPSGGHRFVVDSNLDWGQDLWRLGDWVRAHDVPEIAVDYFGGGDVEHALGDRLAAAPSPRTWRAISFTRLREQSIEMPPPDYVVGHSIAVWHPR